MEHGYEPPVLRVRDLVLHFRSQRGVVQAVDSVSFELARHRAMVVIGESGCGKTSMARALLRLLPRNVERYSGRVELNGEDVMPLPEERFRQDVRWMRMAMVPQAAMNALNPVVRVGDQVAEPAIVHEGLSKKAALERTRQMFDLVGVPQDFISRYPFELSGGMRQRLALAMALITSPDVIILDEPTSALDVLTQANIMNQLKRVKKELGMSFLLITHDIATSSELADQVAVMYAGQIVELGDNYSFFHEPMHPYSKMLMDSVPRLRGDQVPGFIVGQPPSLIGPPTGCRFADRCPQRFEKCVEEPPSFHVVGSRVSKCWLHCD